MTHDELREAVARIVAQGKCKYMPEWTAEEWEEWRKIANRIMALIAGGGLREAAVKVAADWLDPSTTDEQANANFGLLVETLNGETGLEYVWLVELPPFKEGGSPMWFRAGVEWTEDAGLACRFSRRMDAQAVADRVSSMAFPMEHGFERSRERSLVEPSAKGDAP